MSSKNRERGRNPPPSGYTHFATAGILLSVGPLWRGVFQIVFVSPFSFTFFPKREREKKKSEKKNNAGNEPNVSQREQITYTHGTLTRHSPLPGRRAFRVASKGRKDSTPRKSLRALCVDPQETLTLPPPEPLSCFEALFWGLCPWRVFLLRSRLFSREKKKKEDSKIFFFFFPLKKKEDDEKTHQRPFLNKAEQDAESERDPQGYCACESPGTTNVKTRVQFLEVFNVLAVHQVEYKK